MGNAAPIDLNDRENPVFDIYGDTGSDFFVESILVDCRFMNFEFHHVPVNGCSIVDE